MDWFAFDIETKGHADVDDDEILDSINDAENANGVIWNGSQWIPLPNACQDLIPEYEEHDCKTWRQKRATGFDLERDSRGQIIKGEDGMIQGPNCIAPFCSLCKLERCSDGHKIGIIRVHTSLGSIKRDIFAFICGNCQVSVMWDPRLECLHSINDQSDAGNNVTKIGLKYFTH